MSKTSPTLKRPEPEAADHLQNKLCQGSGDLASARQLVHSANSCVNCCVEQSHKDNVHSTAGEGVMGQTADEV